jgi:hypothetical protein
VIWLSASPVHLRKKRFDSKPRREYTKTTYRAE